MSKTLPNSSQLLPNSSQPVGKLPKRFHNFNKSCIFRSRIQYQFFSKFSKFLAKFLQNLYYPSNIFSVFFGLFRFLEFSELQK